MSVPHPPVGTPEITEVQIRLQDSKALKAFVSITLSACFVVRGLKVIEGMNRRFVAMPGRRRRDDTFQDVAHPITREYRDYLETIVLDAFDQQAVRENGAQRRSEIRTEVSAAAEHPLTAEAVVG